jgi:LuxR family maltose regulon positive regulatory protein
MLEQGEQHRNQGVKGEPIMSAKFRAPPGLSWIVRRPRLIERLSAGVRGPLTTIVAPAGSGKTVLASSWMAASAAQGPVVWLSLDRQDRRPGAMWSYVVAGLERVGLPVVDVATPPPGGDESATLIRLAAVLSEQPRPVVLVLDDTQVLTGSGAGEDLDFLVRYAGPQLRLVLLGRVEPDLPLHRYRVAGSITEIHLEELEFTVEEAEALLAAHGVDLPEEEVAALVRRTEGWAAGLRLAAMSWQQRMPATGEPVDLDLRDEIEVYFVAEVLDAQPAEVREFLLRTSIVDHVWPELAVELSGSRDSARMLAALAHARVFVSPDPLDRRRYVYSPLVRDVLRSQLRQERPDELVGLHRTAAGWLAGAGRYADAAAHAAAAGDWSTAASVLVDGLAISDLLGGSRSARRTRVLASMPADLADPAAAVVRAALALGGSDPDGCEKELLRAAELVTGGAANDRPELRLCAAVTELACARVRDDPDAALRAAPAVESALAAVTELGRTVPDDLRVLVQFHRGLVLLGRGDLDGARTALAVGVAVATRAGLVRHRWRLACQGHLALVEAMCGRLRRATEHAREADQAAEATAGAEDAAAPRSVAADLALAWVGVEEYDLRAARDHADRAEEAMRIEPDVIAAGTLALVRARLARARGDATGALTALGQARSAYAGRAPTWLLEKLATVEAAMRAAGGGRDGGAADSPEGMAPPIAPAAQAEPPDAALPASPQAALAAATAQLSRGAIDAATEQVARVLAQADLTVDVRVEAWLLSATCELSRGRIEHVRSALGRALRLAEPERLRRPVLEAPAVLRRFLRRDEELVTRHDWLGTTAPKSSRRHVGAEQADESAPVLEPLTAKETEVLRYLAALLSTEEIARKMFVSVNTVKTHIRGVLRKLAASRRNEAIRRARDLGLV